MYLIGHHGNNFYVASMRLFSTKDKLMEYIYNQWRETLKEIGNKMNEPYYKRFETIEGYVNSISYRVYEFELDGFEGPKNIRSTTVVKWAREWFEKGGQL